MVIPLKMALNTKTINLIFIKVDFHHVVKQVQVQAMMNVVVLLKLYEAVVIKFFRDVRRLN